LVSLSQVPSVDPQDQLGDRLRSAPFESHPAGKADIGV